MPNALQRIGAGLVDIGLGQLNEELGGPGSSADYEKKLDIEYRAKERHAKRMEILGMGKGTKSKPSSGQLNAELDLLARQIAVSKGKDPDAGWNRESLTNGDLELTLDEQKKVTDLRGQMARGELSLSDALAQYAVKPEKTKSAGATGTETEGFQDDPLPVQMAKSGQAGLEAAADTIIGGASGVINKGLDVVTGRDPNPQGSGPVTQNMSQQMPAGAPPPVAQAPQQQPIVPPEAVGTESGYSSYAMEDLMGGVKGALGKAGDFLGNKVGTALDSAVYGDNEKMEAMKLMNMKRGTPQYSARLQEFIRRYGKEAAQKHGLM